MARNAKEFGAGISLAPQSGKPACAPPANCWPHGNAFNIIDRGRAAVEPDICRKWRLQPRHALFTFKAFNKCGFLTANIRARPVMHVNIIRPARICRVFAQQPVGISLIDRALQGFALAHELAAHVNIASMRAHRETGQQATFQQFMRLVAHNIAVFARARLGLVGVDDQIMRSAIIFFWHERPFQTGRETGATATAQAGIFHLVNYPVTAFFDKISCIVPVAPRLGCFQIGTVKSVNIGKDTIFVA